MAGEVGMGWWRPWAWWTILACGTGPSGEGTGPEEDTAREAEVSGGEALFADHCARCHGDDALGTSIAPSLRGIVASDGDPVILAIIQDGRGSMPAMASVLAEGEAQAIVDHLRTLFPSP